MCGRVDFSWDAYDPAVHRLQEVMAGLFAPQALPQGEGFPGTKLPVLTAGTPKAQLQLLHWGIALQNKRLLINARAETAAQKPLFQRDFAARRCVLPTTGFYEWDAARRKFLFRLPQSSLVYLAGFYNADGCFVLLTRSANASMAPVHDRMPVILRQGEVRPYLNEPASADALSQRPGPELDVIAVSA